MRFFKALLAFALLASMPTLTHAAGNDAFSVLVFSKTNGFRHKDAIDAGIPALTQLGQALNFKVDATEDASVFTSENLKKYQAVILLNTTGAFLADRLRKDASQEQRDKAKDDLEARKAAFKNYVENGGAIIGLHSATDGFHNKGEDWPVFHQIIGGSFQHHPQHQNGRLVIVDRTHPSVAHLKALSAEPGSQDAAWTCFDEWYNFKNLQKDNHLILTLDPTSGKGHRTNHYADGSKCDTHPFAWTRSFGKGKIFYTSRGHYGKAFAEYDYVQHVIGGLFWALDRTTPKVDPELVKTFGPKPKGKGKKQ
ncbi:MAG: ThuA domain-containing protein [Puniceicoccales bacterium]|jgi:type 1 glutamine amidotransferase|nr:ThuA domain-containing protein [Puniceicoccales bacterium]